VSKTSNPYPGIPEPAPSVQSLQQTSAALKEATEILLRQRGSPLNAAVTWQDLLDLGLIAPKDVPKK